MPVPMNQALSDRTSRPDELVASGHQVDMVFKRGQKTLSLRAQKIWHLLVKKAGVRLGDETPHRIDLSEFRALGHLPLEARLDALRELQMTIVEVTEWKDGKRGTASGPLLSYVWRPDDDQGSIEWQFSPTLKLIFANSDHWAILSKRAVMAFESRYSLRLYEIIALRSGLDHKTSETFDLESFRDRLGVPVGKLTTWSNLRVFALDPAIAEVNHLAGFHVSYEPLKRGRSVAEVKLSWGEKSPPERKATKRELDGSKMGRKARRAGTVESVVAEPPKLPAASVAPLAAFPADGSISFGRWGELARTHCPRPTPDVDLVASAFRKSRAAAGRSLDGGDIDGHFVNFCKQWRSS
jgi:hypothetical protein